MSGQCIFCSIVSGEAAAEIVAEDEHTVAFMDINPWSRGHALVVPRVHAENLWEIDSADLTHVYLAAKRLARRMEERLGCEKVTFFNSCGAVAGQVVPHFHVHVIPGGPDDPEFRRAALPPDRAELEEVAERLRDGVA